MNQLTVRPVESSSLPAPRFRFGAFEVDVANNEIRKKGLKIKIQEKSFQLLVILIRNAGRITTREELRRGLWSADTFVNFDANLKTTLNKLRHALGDPAENPIFIETIPRHGYRFLAPVVNFESATNVIGATGGKTNLNQAELVEISAWSVILSRLFRRRALVAGFAGIVVMAAVVYAVRSRWVSASALERHRVVLLVLPFDNLTGDLTQQYFSDGMTDEMITLVGRQYPKGLAVIARTSAMSYRGTHKQLPQIARELGGVDYALEGSVRRIGNHVEINAQLFRTRDQLSLWAESYVREVTDLSAIQQDVAGQIARSLVLELDPSRSEHATSARDARVQDAYLRGLYEANKRTEPSLKRSIEYFQEAIQGDPSYAPPYAGLANSYLISVSWQFQSPSEAYPKAKAAALRALKLDPNLAEAHAALAETEHEYEWKWGEAEHEFQRAINLDPNSIVAHKSYAEFLMHAGRNAEAIAEMERARDLDPLALIIDALVGYTYYNARQYDRAIEEYKRVILLDSRFAPVHYLLGATLLIKGQYSTAITEYQSATTLSGGASMMVSGLAQAYALAGRKDLAQRTLLELEDRAKRQYVSPYDVAQVYSSLGDRNAALKMLNQATVEHDFQLMFLKIDHSFDNLHQDPDYERIVKLIGFPQ